MKNVKYLFIGLFIFIVIASFILPGYFLPSDILFTLPSFHKDEWVKPKNSLLGDPVFQFEPWRRYAKSRLQEGEFPLWNDQNSKGVPYFANMQSAILYPLNMLYYFLPASFSLYFIHFLKLFFLLLFSFLYLRSLRCSKDISVLGGFFITFSAFPFVWLQWPHTNVFILFPLLLYITEKIQQGRTNGHRWYALLSFTYFVAILGGHPETLFHMGIIHFSYMLFRLYKERKKIFFSFIAIIAGFFLGAVQLLPFLEYLFQSYSLLHRAEAQDTFFLPIQSIMLLFFPFFLGSPHQEFYRSFAGTNFQEAIGGYVGICVLLLGGLGIVRLFGVRRNSVIAFWAVTVGVLFALTYKIWPFYLLTQIPIFSVSANQRISGFMAFGIVVIAIVSLQSFVEKKVVINQMLKKRTLSFFIPACFISLLTIGLLPLFFRNVTERESEFIGFLQIHLLVIFLTTILFLLFLWLICIKRQKISPSFLLIPIAFQTIVLFWNYNPVTQKGDYYPKTELIQTLQKLPKGSILEVGNPQLPQNLNLAYALEHIENYDVLEIKTFKDKFNALFPDKNHWGKVDSVDENHLREMGIAYVISDYDLRLIKQKIQTEQNNRLALDSHDKKIRITFKPTYSDLRAVRLLTANFNRENTCSIIISLQEKETKRRIAESELPCTNINNNMFYSVRFKQAKLQPSKEYELIFQSPNASYGNSIALLGNRSQQPYVELLYGDKNNRSYDLLWNKNSVYAWKVSGVNNIGSSGSTKILRQKPEEKLVETSSNTDQRLYLKQPYYPGWEAKVDGKDARLLNANPFIAVDVPKGKHVVSINYRPFSVYIGAILTLLTAFILCVYLARRELAQPYMINLFTNWKRWAVKTHEHIPWYRHCIVFGAGVLVSLAVFTAFFRLFPVHFSPSETTAINWLTVHHYPKQLDYIYFLVGFPFVVLLSTLLWLLWLLRRKD